MKCLTCFFSLFALLIFSLYLSGCYMGFITEAEPDPRKIVDIQGDTQKFSVNGVEPANGNGRFEWVIWRDDDLEHIDSGKEFIWQMPLEGERNKLEVVCYLVTTGWVYLIPGVHMCGGWYMPPCGWYENTGWIDRRIWEVRISQEPPVWKGDYIIESDMDAQALNGFTEVTGSLLIRCEETDFHKCSEELFSIEVLDNLILIGGDLIIVGNQSLTTLAGLDSLTTVGGDFTITENINLCIHLAGDLKYQVLHGGGIGGDISINSNKCCECTDTDNDGYGEFGCEVCPEIQVDCDDSNADANPGRTEGPYGDIACSDALDNDCDGNIDAHDDGCCGGVNDLVAYYPFNGNGNDESGNGYNGTVNGAILTHDRYGSPDSAYSFDGGDDYILIENNICLNPDTITYGGWYKFNDQEASQVLISKTQYAGYSIWLNEGSYPNRITCFVRVGSSYTTASFLIDELNLSAWNQIYVTFDGFSVKLYYNGQVMDELFVTGVIKKSGVPLIFGAEPESSLPPTKYFNGLIDDIRIYGTALTETQVEDLYNQEKP